MAKIKGTTVTLYEKVRIGTDSFGTPVYQEEPVEVANVIVGQPETDDIVSTEDLFGKRLFCYLGIPKGDPHSWEDARVDWTDKYGETHRLRTFGFAITGIEENIPLDWHKKVRAERIEQGQV